MDFFFNDTSTTEIYTLSLHDALPIFDSPDDLERFWLATTPDESWTNMSGWLAGMTTAPVVIVPLSCKDAYLDRKSTRLNSSHANISYAVFCLKKKKNISIPVTSITLM